MYRYLVVFVTDMYVCVKISWGSAMWLLIMNFYAIFIVSLFYSRNIACIYIYIYIYIVYIYTHTLSCTSMSIFGVDTPVMALWKVWNSSFIAITPRSTLTHSVHTCSNPIDESKRCVCNNELFICSRWLWRYIFVP